MQHTRKEVGIDQKFVLLTFTRAKGEQALRDVDIREATISGKRLRPVSRNEFDVFHRDILKGHAPKIRIAAFGNIARGPAESGSLPGVPYVDTDGKIKVIEHWTRGNTGHQWDDEWEFLFAPVV